MNYVLDTNAVLYLLAGRNRDSIPERQCFISVITEMELFSYPSLEPSEENKIRFFLKYIPAIDVTREIVEETIRLRRIYGLKLPDTIVAATALTLNAELITNDKGITRISELHIRSIDI